MRVIMANGQKLGFESGLTAVYRFIFNINANHKNSFLISIIS